MAAQIEMSVSNLEAVLESAGMTLADVVRLNVYTTDFDDLLKNWASLKDRFASSEGGFATSLLGVTRLAAPTLLVLLEATAVS
jgi:enamine deaminase RidA (YjgF/YER057c/UK114 family)